jgi:hypothetical protein
MKKIFALLILLFTIHCTNAQSIDFSGVWNGKFYNNTSFSVADDTYRFEVQIAQTGKGLEGVTYSYLNTSFYGKAGHNGYVKTDGKKIVVQETRMIELRSMGGGACLMTCTMKYSKVGEEEFLEGSYTAVDAKYGTPCEGGYVKLKKIKKSIFGIEPKVKKKLDEIERRKLATNAPATVPKPAPKPAPKAPIVKPVPKPTPVTPTPAPKPPVPKAPTPKPQNPAVVKTPTPKTEPKVPATVPEKKPDIVVAPKPPVKKIDLPPAPPALVERKNEIVKTIYVANSEGVTLDFYDYGEVDGDIVTIYVNNKKVVDKQMLGARPIQVPIEVSESNPEVTVTMYADNLGSVPPNTAYMTVRVDGEKYEATIESSEQKNASVKFVYKKK